MLQFGKEFQEIAQCGGQFTVNVKTDTDGRRGIAFGFRLSRPNAASLFAIYALPEGVPVGTIQQGASAINGTLSCPITKLPPSFHRIRQLRNVWPPMSKVQEILEIKRSAFALANDLPLLWPKGRMPLLFDYGPAEIYLCMCRAYYKGDGVRP